MKSIIWLGFDLGAVAQRIVSPKTMRRCVNASFCSALSATVRSRGFVNGYSFNNL
jgi:hypothetical protein